MVRTIVFILILSSNWLVGQEQRAVDHAVLHAYCDTSNYYVGDLIKYTIDLYMHIVRRANRHANREKLGSGCTLTESLVASSLGVSL